MPFIQMGLALVILTILYVRMIRRETPEQISRPQAILPVVFGAVATPLSFVLFLLMGSLLLQLGLNVGELPGFPRALIQSLFGAGIPEEIAKMALLLLTLLIFRSRIRNVYEYMLAGAGIGFGFTLLEEFIYGSDGLAALGRLITIGAHMIFGILMARHLGLAACRKAAGQGGAAKHYALALLVPMVIHTVYDALTVHNWLMDDPKEELQIVGILLAILAMAGLVVLQFLVLRRLRTNADKYIALQKMVQ